MGNSVYDFDLHMEVGTSWYCGDASITCEVTFPSPTGQPSIKIDYDTTGNDNLKDAITRALEDIWAYMRDPEAWESEYIKHSSEDWRKLKAVQENIRDYRKRIEDSQKTIAYNQKWLAENEAKAAELEARIKEQEHGV